MAQLAWKTLTEAQWTAMTADEWAAMGTYAPPVAGAAGWRSYLARFFWIAGGNPAVVYADDRDVTRLRRGPAPTTTSLRRGPGSSTTALRRGPGSADTYIRRGPG